MARWRSLRVWQSVFRIPRRAFRSVSTACEAPSAMKESSNLSDHLRQVEEDMATMRTAVKKAQAASLARGVPIAYLIDGVMHYELPSGEITRENPWKDAQPRATEG